MNKPVLAIVACLAAAGCHRHGPVKSAHVSEPGTHVVASPGALTVAQISSTPRTCTMRVSVGPGKGKHAGGHGKQGRGKQGKGRAHKMHQAPRHSPGPDGGAGVLDTLMFRLCESRANNDITAAQYQELLKELLELAKHRAMNPPPPPWAHPGMGGPHMRRGMGPKMKKGRRFWHGERDVDDEDSAGEETKPPKPDPAETKKK